MLRQLPPGRRVDRVADLLPAGGRRGNLKLVLQACLFHQVLHHILGHRTPTNIAVTHKKDLPHVPDTPHSLYFSQYSRNPTVRRVWIAAIPRPGSAPAAPPWSIGAPVQPGDTRRVLGCPHSPPKWPHFASSPVSGSALATLDCRHRPGIIPASGASCVGRSPWPPNSFPGDTRRP